MMIPSAKNTYLLKEITISCKWRNINKLKVIVGILKKIPSLDAKLNQSVSN